MRIFDVGQVANGFIAIGQEATGVIAIGQLATGFIAIGQVARGVIAIGMLSYGVVSVGMLSCGLVFCSAMLGAGGRAGPSMLVLPLVPRPPKRNKYPPTISVEAALGGAPGWVEARLDPHGAGVRAIVGNHIASVGKRLAQILRAMSTALPAPALVQLRRDADGSLFVVKAMPRKAESGELFTQGNLITWALQLAALAAACIGYAYFVLIPLGHMAVYDAPIYLAP